jgi:hypothetical protein
MPSGDRSSSPPFPGGAPLPAARAPEMVGERPLGSAPSRLPSVGPLRGRRFAPPPDPSPRGARPPPALPPERGIRSRGATPENQRPPPGVGEGGVGGTPRGRGRRPDLDLGPGSSTLDERRRVRGVRGGLFDPRPRPSTTTPSPRLSTGDPRPSRACRPGPGATDGGALATAPPRLRRSRDPRWFPRRRPGASGSSPRRRPGPGGPPERPGRRCPRW